MNTRDILGALARTPEPTSDPEPDGYVIGVRDGERLHLTDASVRKTRESAEEELGQWRRS